MEPNSKAHRLFEQMNVLIAGEELGTVMEALEEMICSGLCGTAKSKSEAFKLAARVHREVRALIDERYEFYHAQAAGQPDEPKSRA